MKKYNITTRCNCRLQLLLVLASAVIFGSELRGIRDHILLYQIQNFLFRRRGNACNSMVTLLWQAAA
jgi:hypothetical protein